MRKKQIRLTAFSNITKPDYLKVKLKLCFNANGVKLDWRRGIQNFTTVKLKLPLS